MEFEVRYLPSSARRYVVSRCGKVFTNEMLPVTVDDDGSKLTVAIQWVAGELNYDLALLVMVTYDLVDLPDHLWLEYEPLFKDSNYRNVHLDNLTYRFKTRPLPAEGYENFFIVPFFTRYAISRDGQMLNRSTGKILTWTVSKPDMEKNSPGGYRYARAIGLHKRSMVIFRHRALGWTFLEYDASVSGLVINHCDGNPGNDSIDNIQWTTYRENNMHAVRMGLRSKRLRPVTVKDYNSGEIQDFACINDAVIKYPFLTRFEIAKRTNDWQDRLYPDKLIFRNKSDNIDWPEESKLIPFEEGMEFYATTFCALNIVTGETLIFRGLNEGERLTGVSSSYILVCCRNRKDIPVKGFVFRYLEDGRTWPTYTERHIEIFRNHPEKPGNGVTVTNVETGEELFFCCIPKAAKHFNISEAYTRTLCINHNKGKTGLDYLLDGKFEFNYFIVTARYTGSRTKET